MVTIISKSDGPRREDEAARRLIDVNRATITRLADHLTQGAYSASRADRAARVAQPLVAPSAARRSSASRDDPRPFVKLSPNGRVLLVDLDSGRQLAFLGEVRRRDGRDVFVLARASNGFAVDLDEAIADAVADLDGVPVDGRESEQSLKSELTMKLGLA